MSKTLGLALASSSILRTPGCGMARTNVIPGVDPSRSSQSGTLVLCCKYWRTPASSPRVIAMRRNSCVASTLAKGQHTILTKHNAMMHYISSLPAAVMRTHSCHHRPLYRRRHLPTMHRAPFFVFNRLTQAPECSPVADCARCDLISQNTELFSPEPVCCAEPVTTICVALVHTINCRYYVSR